MAIINDILDLSKIEAGMMRLESQPFSIRELSHSIEVLFQEKVKEKHLAFHRNVEDGVPDILVGDATRFTQILVNLIGNALKFTEKGRIGLDIFVQGQQGNMEQSGKGIPCSWVYESAIPVSALQKMSWKISSTDFPRQRTPSPENSGEQGWAWPS